MPAAAGSRSWLGALAAAAVATLALAPAAQGHGETTPLVRTVADGVTPGAPGVTFAAVPGQPLAVVLRNTGARDVIVSGLEGEDFLRVGPAGTYANLDSPTWYASGNPEGLAVDLPPSARRGAPVEWRRVSPLPAWGWFDRRVQPLGHTVPREARGGRRVVRLIDWSLPARVGGEQLRLRGHVEYRPPVGSIITGLDPPRSPRPFMAVVLGSTSPGLFVDDTGGAPLTVIGSDGRPFARIAGDGVRLNVNSPTYLAGLVAMGARAGPRDDATPSWRKVADVPRYGWVDPRLRYRSLDPPAAVARSERPVVLERWSVPVDTAGRRVLLTGTKRWVPLAAPGVTSAPPTTAGERLVRWLAACALALMLSTAAALWLRRRQAREPASRPAPHAQRAG